MNYLAEIKKLKQREEEKKDKLERIKEDKEKNGKEYLSNLTFMNFEKYILERIPLFIEESLKKETFDNKVTITFNLREGFFDNVLLDEYQTLGVVKKNEFLKYINRIPGLLYGILKSGTFRGVFDLETLANFYFEKLQELEYYNIDYSSKSR